MGGVLPAPLIIFSTFVGYIAGGLGGALVMIAAVTISILETSVTDVYTALIALGAFAALNRWHSKLTVVYVMAVAGVVGVVLQHTVV
jgi:chromate transporter